LLSPRGDHKLQWSGYAEKFCYNREQGHEWKATGGEEGNGAEV
jgi:hypothetical protein